MCQGKHSGHAIDILPSCKVTEDHFQMKPASLKRHNCLDSEKRNTETKLFSISVTRWIFDRIHGAADER